MLFFTGSITLHMSRHTDRQTDTEIGAATLSAREAYILKY